MVLELTDSPWDDTDADPTFVPSSYYSSSSEGFSENKRRTTLKRACTLVNQSTSVIDKEELLINISKDSLSNLDESINTSGFVSQASSDELSSCSSRESTNIPITVKRSFTMPKRKRHSTPLNADFTENSSDSSVSHTEDEPRINVTNLLEHFDNIADVNPEVREKFHSLNINVNWDIPPAHMKLNYRDTDEMDIIYTESGSRKYSLFFTKEEDDIIISNWNVFKEIYEFDDPHIFFPGVLNSNTFKHTERRKFAQFLSRGLPNRRLRTVYIRFRDIFCKLERKGRFTCREDRLIYEVMNLPQSYLKSKSKTKLLMAFLKRSRNAVHRRWVFLQKHGSDHIDWNLDFCSKLIQALLKEHKVDTVKELLKVWISRETWMRVSNELDCCSYRLESFWLYRLSVQLSCRKPIYRNKLREELINWFYSRRLEIDNIDNIDWISLCRHLEIPSLFFVYQKLRTMIITYVPQNKLHCLKMSIKHLHKHFLPLLQSGRLKDYRLTRLRYTDGVLVKLN